ncbi:acetamidase/formamidase family protein [Horticoccus sp. 23ND18S-11]|uniref:acetamidase/formamidase family protein n=1 Tax=Horticoccus sp. 23ND18S-11 TaxID=3391832 RepID=UPI0039C9DD0B
MNLSRARAVAFAATASSVTDAPAVVRAGFVSTRSVIALATLAVAGLVPARAIEIPYDHHVPFTPETAIIGHFSPTKKPVLTVKSGATVRIDGGGGQRWREDNPNQWLKENNIATTIETNAALAETIKVLKESTHRLPPPPNTPPGTVMSGGGHLLVGPIAVEGAEPGDSLEVRILDVTPRIPYGTVGATPGRGALPDLVPRPWTRVVHIDLKRNVCIFDARTEVPLAPFMGVMGTCPPDSEGPMRKSGPPGTFGGNLDCKELIAGSTLYLPVYQKGALFYTGDSHAAQGDGEITINAVETANVCTLQFILHKGKKLSAPRAETPTHFLTFGLDPDLDAAMRMAMIQTVDFLKEYRKYDFFEAYALASIGIDFRVTQVVDGTLGIHAMIPKKLFRDELDTYWYRTR